MYRGEELLRTGGEGNSHSPIMYSKCPQISNTLFHTILAQILLFKQLFLKILSGPENSVDPDQTALSGEV